MIKKIFCFLLSAVAALACNNSSKNNPTTDSDVATTFIRATLDNDFSTAEKYLLDDVTSRQYFENFKRGGGVSKDKTEQDKYKAADIVINSLTPVNDSTTIVNYSNSYKKGNNTQLKLIMVNSKWLVDFKYTFADNSK